MAIRLLIPIYLEPNNTEWPKPFDQFTIANKRELSLGGRHVGMYLQSQSPHTNAIGFLSGPQWQPNYKLRPMLELTIMGRSIRYVVVTVVGVEFQVIFGDMHQKCHIATGGLHHSYLT
jgi:hypothetical protein